MGYSTLIRLGTIPGTYDPASQIWASWFQPFCVYGFGAVACALVLIPAKDLLKRRFPRTAAPLALSFAVNTLACVGLVSTLMTWVVLPRLEKRLAVVPSRTMNAASVAIVAGFAVLLLQGAT